jgi:acyl-coenzyme A synthetase/AMP-(fatty) acid ligase
MTPTFPMLLAAIAAIGVVHTIASRFREKADQRRKREALARLDFRTWRAPD